MVDPYDVLSRRAVGELPLSIGTSLAIEALAENKTYDTLWINIRTLFRNIYQSIDQDERQSLIVNNKFNPETAVAIADAIEEEIGHIRHYLSDKIEGVRVYGLEYKDLLRKYPHALLKIPNTDKQKLYANLMDAALEEVMRNDDNQVFEWDKGSELSGEIKKSLIITHYPTDLLSKSKFKQLRLIESHTGAIKSRSQWGSKLTDGKSMPMLPFNKFTIQVFGDGPTHFLGYPIKVKRAVLEMAVDNRWTPLTTVEKIRYNLKHMKDQFAGKQLLDFL